MKTPFYKLIVPAISILILLSGCSDKKDSAQKDAIQKGNAFPMDQFIASYAINKDELNKSDAAAKQYEETLVSKDPEELKILELRRQIEEFGTKNRINNGDSLDTKNQKASNLLAAGSAFYDACKDNPTMTCKYFLPIYERNLIVKYATSSENVSFYLSDAAKRLKALADIGNIWAMRSLAEIYGRFQNNTRFGANFYGKDELAGTYAPPLVDVGTAVDYYRKSMNAGDIDACNKVMNLFWEYDQPNYIDTYQKKLGVAKACLANYENLKTFDAYYKGLSAEQHANILKNINENFIQFAEKSKSDFIDKQKLLPYYLKISCWNNGSHYSFEACFTDQSGPSYATSFSTTVKDKTSNYNLQNGWGNNDTNRMILGDFNRGTGPDYYLMLPKDFKASMSLARAGSSGANFELVGELLDSTTGAVLEKKSSTKLREVISFSGN